MTEIITDNEICKMADAYADDAHENYTNDFHGFITGAKWVKDEVANLIKEYPNDMDLGEQIKILFNLEKDGKVCFIR